MLNELDAIAGLGRGVHKLRRKFLGRNMYVALTGERDLVGDCIHIASPRETDAELVKRLRGELDTIDPPRAQLKLLPRTVMPAIDGPSPTHPNATDILEKLRAALEKAAQYQPTVAVETDPKHDVARRLSDLLYGRSA